MEVLTFAMLHVKVPLTFVVAAVRRSPNSVSVFGAQFPMAFKDLAIFPPKDAMTVFQIVQKRAFVNTVMLFDKASASIALQVLSFKYFMRSDFDTQAMFNSLLDSLAKVEYRAWCNNFEAFLWS